MRQKLKLAASLLMVAALALIAATTVAAATYQKYTCTKVKQNGQTDVLVSVSEAAVGGLTNAGYTCVADVSTDEDESESAGDEEDTGLVSDSSPESDPEPETGGGSSTASAVETPPESRSLYCSTTGPAFRANGEGMGIALNLSDSQGALLVGLGLVTPAIFYQGIGASCDPLPGFTDSGTWVDHVGDVVPGVAVYPYYVPTAS